MQTSHRALHDMLRDASGLHALAPLFVRLILLFVLCRRRCRGFRPDTDDFKNQLVVNRAHESSAQSGSHICRWAKLCVNSNMERFDLFFEYDVEFDKRASALHLVETNDLPERIEETVAGQIVSVWRSNSLQRKVPTAQEC